MGCTLHRQTKEGVLARGATGILPVDLRTLGTRSTRNFEVKGMCWSVRSWGKDPIVVWRNPR